MYNFRPDFDHRLLVQAQDPRIATRTHPEVRRVAVTVSGRAEVDPTQPLGQIFPPIPPERNGTEEYTKTIQFMNYMYGLDFSNGRQPRGAILMQTDVEVYNVDMASIPGFETKIVMTDLGMHEDTYSALLTEDTVLYGAFGGENGTWAK